MKRHEKVHKLANAIKEYRGVYDAKTGIWKRHPKPSVELRVCKWLRELRIDTLEGLNTVKGFKHFDEFNKWMKQLDVVPIASVVAEKGEVRGK